MEWNFRIVYMDENRQKHNISPQEASNLKPKDLSPIRFANSYRGQRHLPGLYWFATTESHILYESRLELQTLRMLDFDPSVDDVAAQPFAVSWKYLSVGRPMGHVPDYFASRSDKADLIVDVKDNKRSEEPKFRRVADATNELCGLVGWDYEVRSEHDPIVLANVEWLCGFRHTPIRFNDLAGEIVDLAKKSQQAHETITVGHLFESSSSPWFVRPVVFHLLWLNVLVIDIEEPLLDSSVVRLRNTQEEDAGHGR